MFFEKKYLGFIQNSRKDALFLLNAKKSSNEGSLIDHTTGLWNFFSFKIYDLLKIHKAFKQHEISILEYMQDIRRISESDPVTRDGTC